MENVKIVQNYDQEFIGYLNLIQGNISRMAANSALMKGFAATVITAMLGMCVADDVKWHHIAIAVLPILAFIRLDVFYLQLERRYRNLYSLVIEKRNFNDYYILDFKNLSLLKYKDEIYKNSGFFETIKSVSVYQFYGWFVMLLIILIIFTAWRRIYGT